jgi:PAS domain S-box-containing protein
MESRMTQRSSVGGAARSAAGRTRLVSAAAIVAAYAVVGIAWVLASDVLVRVLLPGRPGELITSVKGVGFVVATTIALWGVLAARDRVLARLDRERFAAVEATTAIFRSSPLAIVATDRDGRITAWSPVAERVLGWREDEVVGRPATVLRPDDPAWVARGLAEVMAGETLVAVPVRYPHRDGRARELELFVAPLRDDRGAVRGSVVVAEDVTEIHQAQADRARLATAIDSAAEGIVVTDPQARIVYANPAIERITGYTRAELIGQKPSIFRSGVQDRAFYQRLWGALLGGETWRGLLVNRRKDGAFYEEEATISPVLDAAGVATAYVAVKRDLSVERALEAELRAEVRDRLAVREAVAGITAGATPEETAASILGALTRLEGIEHPSVFHLPAQGPGAVRLAGMLPGRAEIRGEVMDGAIAAYLRGRAAAGAWLHDFSTEDPPGPGAAAIVRAAGLTAGAYAPVLFDGVPVAVVGGLTSRAATADFLSRRLVALVEVATHVAPILGPQLAARDDVEGARGRILAIARRGAFHPVFQPIVRLEDRSVIGFEALTRFDDGVAPDRRFAQAAELGCGRELEAACLRAAVAAGADLPPGAWLTLNASPAMLASGGIGALIGDAGRPIVIELTERVEVDDYPALRAALEALGDGVTLAVDDTGAGFAGLRQLVELRPHVVKLDAAVVRGVEADPVRQSLVAGLVHYASQTGTHLVAEGVETAGEADLLAALGVELGQGHLFARPAPLEVRDAGATAA